MENQKRFRDASLRLQSHDYSKQGFYFVTICSHQREHLFGRIENGDMILNRNGSIAHQFWYTIIGRFPRCRTRAFVVKPNHIHGIIEIISNSTPRWDDSRFIPTKRK